MNGQIGKTGISVRGRGALPAAAAAAAALLLALPRESRAQADIPYYANTEVVPNILFVVDLSGSMDWDFQAIDHDNNVLTAPVIKSRLATAKKALTGRYSTGVCNTTPPTQDGCDSLNGVVDVFGSQINFAFAAFSGSPLPTSSSLNFPNGGNASTFQNQNNPGLESSILAQSANGGTPTAQAMRDAGCWLIGNAEMNKALNIVETSPEPSSGKSVNPLIAGKFATAPNPPVLYQNICPNSLSTPTLTACPGPASCDPSFVCRRTYALLLTDGQELNGWGCTPTACPNNAILAPGPAPQQDKRRTLAAALRRTKYTAPSLPPDEQGILTFVGLLAPCADVKSYPAVFKDKKSYYAYLSGGGTFTVNIFVGAVLKEVYTGTSTTALITSINTTVSGTATAGAASTITLAAPAVATAGAYVGKSVTITAGAGAGQTRRITAYTAARVATVDSPWTLPIPNNTSKFTVGSVLVTAPSYVFVPGGTNPGSNLVIVGKNVLPGGDFTVTMAGPAGGFRLTNYACDEFYPDGTIANQLVHEGHEWARYGGTDATPGTDGCQPNDDGQEAFLARDIKELTNGLQTAIGCAIAGSHTRATPAFTVTSTNFAEDFEIDGFFEVKPGYPWWKGHLTGTDFKTINDKGGVIKYEDIKFDAGDLLTKINVPGTRNLKVSLKQPFQATPVKPGDPTQGAKLGEVPPAVLPGDMDKFVTGGAAQTAMADIMAQPAAAVGTLIDFLRDEDGPDPGAITFTNGVQKIWSLGPIVNSSPLLVRPPFFDFRVGQGETYADFIRTHTDDPEVLYAGAQDGFMHAFNLKDVKGTYKPGQELWGFMPYEAILRMPSMRQGVIFSVDGSPQASVVPFYGAKVTGPGADDDDAFRTVLTFGLRSGGFSYVALDITDPQNPALLWQVTHPSMGRTTSTPNLAGYRVNWVVGATTLALSRWLMAIGAGYNPVRTDGDPIPINPVNCADIIDADGDGELDCVDAAGKIIPPGAQTVGADLGIPGIGNWVLFYDVETGTLVQNVQIADEPYDAVKKTGDPRRNSIPGDLLALDRDLNGSTDNVVFSDVEGRVWKILTTKPDVATWRTNTTGDPLNKAVDASPCVLFDPASIGYPRRPSFYAPAATFDCNGYVNLIWGTGDLSDPNSVSTTDYLFAVNDRAASSCNATLGAGKSMEARDFQCDRISDKVLDDAVKNSFPYKLLPGEKILSTPLIVNGQFYLTTFIPFGSSALSNVSCTGGGSRLITGPAICCGIEKADDADLTAGGDYGLRVSEIMKAAPPLILGPSGEVMSVATLSGGSKDSTGTLKTTFSELSHNRRLLHWVNVFSADSLPTPPP